MGKSVPALGTEKEKTTGYRTGKKAAASIFNPIQSENWSPTFKPLQHQLTLIVFASLPSKISSSQDNRSTLTCFHWHAFLSLLMCNDGAGINGVGKRAASAQGLSQLSQHLQLTAISDMATDDARSPLSSRDSLPLLALNPRLEP